jgi:NADH-quinone oxidoreductase subunit H
MNPLVRGLLYGFVVLSVLMTAAAWGIWFERKFSGRMQNRLGPTFYGPMGLLQPVVDGFKLLQKEFIIPERADRVLFVAAPPLTVLLSLGVAAVIPFGPDVVAADLDVGVLYVLALGSLTAVPVWTAGWSSNNKYSMLGGMRAVAQGISYEIPLVLAVLVPVIFAGSMSLSDIVRYQIQHGWLAFSGAPGLGLIAFLFMLPASLAEANRIPFDIPEAESELIAGVSTEYTGMGFGLLYLAEYLHTLNASALAAVLFFGGWDGPFAPGLHWMVLKTVGLFVGIYWVRWSLIRFRSDQLMTLCWRYLVPGGLLLVLASALWVFFIAGGAA